MNENVLPMYQSACIIYDTGINKKYKTVKGGCLCAGKHCRYWQSSFPKGLIAK